MRATAQIRSRLIPSTALVIPDDRAAEASCTRNGRQTEPCQSYSRWLSQLDVLTSGGPLPAVAYARRTPSADLQKRIRCCIAVVVGRDP
jgi:hypothetical protein